jgi:hypothetical protein
MPPPDPHDSLRRHHVVDRGLVRHRDLVDHVLVLAALDARGRGGVVRQREHLLRLRARHRCGPRRGCSCRSSRVALAAHDVRLRAHGARDDAELALPRAHRALAGHEHVLAVVMLARHVVVVTVHRHEPCALNSGRSRRASASSTACIISSRFCAAYSCAHDTPPRSRRSARTLGKYARSASGSWMNQRSHLLLGALDEVRADAVPDAARARVQHHPHPPVLVQADLDEVVARAERTQLVHALRVDCFAGCVVEDARRSPAGARPCGRGGARARRATRRGRSCATAVRAAVRHRRLDGRGAADAGRPAAGRRAATSSPPSCRSRCPRPPPPGSPALRGDHRADRGARSPRARPASPRPTCG